MDRGAVARRRLRLTCGASALRIAEVAKRHNVPLRYHTGIPMGYTAAYSYGFLGPANSNPLWAHDIAAAFPDLVLEPNIGPEKLLWGTDWGASMQIYSQLGRTRRAVRSSCARRKSSTTRSIAGDGACAR
jgi:hypothetical protein